MTKERKPTIWEALAAKLGREPTHKEACDEVRRILFDEGDANPVKTAGRGALPHQRKPRAGLRGAAEALLDAIDHDRVQGLGQWTDALRAALAENGATSAPRKPPSI
jgi:hypothetical protein